MTDIITTAVIRESLTSIVREMRRMMIQSSFSSIIYEGYDFSAVIIDAKGRLISQSGEDHPFHIIPVTWSVSGLLEKVTKINKDSIYLHNDPYTGGTHLNDVAVIYPIFFKENLTMFVVIRSHWADIGGTTPGSLSGKAKEILHEGLRLNHICVPKNGKSEVMDLIFDNVRISEEALSDFYAVLGTCRVAERRLIELISKYGLEVTLKSIDNELISSEKEMRNAIESLPNGNYQSVAYLDGASEETFPLRVEASLSVYESEIVADFNGTSMQVDAPLNAGPAIAPTSVMTVIKSFLIPSGTLNSGTVSPIKIKVPRKTILSAENPAPCGGLNEVRFACDTAIIGALSQIIPRRMTGDVRGTSNHTYIGGFDFQRDKPFLFYEYPSGGTGAFEGSDGNHAVRAFNEGENVSIQSIEMVEAKMPLFVEKNEIRPDSGGAGRFRGGCGIIREIRLKTENARFSTLSDRNLIPPFGINGGQSGAPNKYTVIRGGKEINTTNFPGKIADFILLKEDVIRIESSGGGGFGFAHERELNLIEKDWKDGIISEAGLSCFCTKIVKNKLVRQYELRKEISILLKFNHSRLGDSQCIVSKEIMERLNLTDGQMVEVFSEHGPPLRFWVSDFVNSNDTVLEISSYWENFISSKKVNLRSTSSGNLQFIRKNQ